MKKGISVIALLLVGVGGPFLRGQQAPPSFLNLVAVGDSLTAGFQSGSLNEEGQTHSYAALVARQVGTFLFLPLITRPGIPNELMLVDPGPPPVIEPMPGEGGTRSFPLIVPQNLAVPGQTVEDALTVRPDLPLDSLEDVVLGVPILLAPLGIPPLSQLELAFALKPTFTIFWLGSNDVLGAALTADPAAITPIPVFAQSYPQAVGTILASGSKLIVANIPDVTVIPFLSSAEEVAAVVGAPLGIVGPILGISQGDFVTANGIPLVAAILQGELPGPLPGNVVLTASEAAVIQAATAQMNAIIDGVAANFGVPVVDIHGLLADLDANGMVVNGVPLGTGFLGGLFSLDGIHPTNTGNAVVANAFIDRINSFYGLKIPAVDVASVLAQDPLVFAKGSADLPPALLSVGAREYEEMMAVLLPSRRGRAEESVPLVQSSDPAGRTVDQVGPALRAVRILPGPLVPEGVGNRSGKQH